MRNVGQKPVACQQSQAYSQVVFSTRSQRIEEQFSRALKSSDTDTTPNSFSASLYDARLRLPTMARGFVEYTIIIRSLQFDMMRQEGYHRRVENSSRKPPQLKRSNLQRLDTCVQCGRRERVVETALLHLFSDLNPTAGEKRDV